MPTFTTPDGRPIHYERRGDDGPWLILLNGMSQSTANWMSQARALSQRFRVVMYDARGQGRSPLGAGQVTWAGHLADLDALLDHLEVVSATLCGFSHGARIALGYAAEHPDRVSQLVLTSIGDHDDALRRAIVRSWREILALGGVEAMAWCAIPDILGRDFLTANEAQLDAMIRATVQRNSAEGLGALLEAMATFPPPSGDASRVECPTLLITSAQDLLVSEASADRLAQRFGDVVHERIADCGHTIPIERADAWRALVEGVLG